MDFKDQIFQLSERIERLKENINTEEATKNALIMPFITALGYDVFNPLEVMPELDCDLVKKKGEKIDYAIMKDNTPIILIECKHWNQDLNLHDTQIKKYFVASKARFGVLTNGIEYRFYTDLERPNIMDEKPFMVVNILDISDSEIEQIKKFHKSYFDESDILSTAQELKYTTELRNKLNTEFNSPSTDFVRFFTKSIYEGQINQKVIEQFTPLIKRAIAGIINDTISDRLGLAIRKTPEQAVADEINDSKTASTIKELPDGVVYMSDDGNIVTTQEEIDGFHIVKAILCSCVDVERVFYRDAQSYFSIILDNNNRKPICRFYFNSRNKMFIELIDENKKGHKHEIASLDKIYDYSEQLRNTTRHYDSK